jgi:hypothetical protein
MKSPSQVSSTRSVRMNLARPFKAGERSTRCLRRVATSETRPDSIVALRRGQAVNPIPALKRRAKFIPKLRVEGLSDIDRALIIGGKCEISNGSGKSPGLNQLVPWRASAKCIAAPMKVSGAARVPLETSSYFAQNTQSTIGCFKRFLRGA